MLSETLQYWTGPMSLAIYVKRSELDALVKTIYTDFPLLLERKNIDIHFVLQSGVSIHGQNMTIVALLEHPKNRVLFKCFDVIIPSISCLHVSIITGIHIFCI